MNTKERVIIVIYAIKAKKNDDIVIIIIEPACCYKFRQYYTFLLCNSVILEYTWDTHFKV